MAIELKNFSFLIGEGDFWVRKTPIRTENNKEKGGDNKEKALAQTTLVTVERTVTDEEGAFLPGVAVAVKNIETGYTKNTVTQTDRSYRISGIQPGKYECELSLQGITLTVSLKGENTLVASIPGQGEIELVPYKGTEFNLKNLAGLSIEFIVDESGTVTEAKITQPNGVFTAEKK